MENKILEFVREFNTNLDQINQYSLLQYSNDGFTQSISLPEINIFDDDNYGEDRFKRVALSRLLKVVSEISTTAEEMLIEEISIFEKTLKSRIKEEFPKSKFSFFRVATLRWKIVMSGEYDEDKMGDFLDGFTQGFYYEFEDCRLDLEY